MSFMLGVFSACSGQNMVDSSTSISTSDNSDDSSNADRVNEDNGGGCSNDDSVEERLKKS